MSFSNFMTNVSPLVRLLLAIAVTVGVTLLCARIFRQRILKLAQEPGEIEGKTKMPMLLDVSGSIIGLTTMAFVFLTAFGFSNFWSMTRAAETATQSEAVQYSTAMRYVDLLTDPALKSVARSALEAYRENVITAQQPLLQAADHIGVYREQSLATRDAGYALIAARTSDPTKSPLWSDIYDSFTNMTDYGFDRVRALPGTVATSYLVFVLIMGIVNLVMIAAFRPTTWGRNAFLLAMAALVTAVMTFVVVEVSNPYVGGGAVQPVLALYR